MNKELKEMIKRNSYPKQTFSKAQLSNMRAINLVEFMEWYDASKIVVIRGNVRLAENHSVVLNYIWARDFVSGSSYTAIDFCINYLGLSTYGAMYVLNEYLKQEHTNTQPISTLVPIETIENKLASGKYARANNIKSIYGYLCKTRQLPSETVRHFMDEEYLFAEKLDNGYNLLFPIYNSEEKITGFECSGILSDKRYRYKGCIISQAYTGFNYQYNYIRGTEEIVYAFESSIDLMSFVALANEGYIKLPEDKSVFMLSLRGLQSKVLSAYATADTQIALCVDNDTAGESFYTAEHNKYNNMVYCGSLLKRYGVKDWNDLLKIKDSIKTPIKISL